jgi:hypothetical protein
MGTGRPTKRTKERETLVIKAAAQGLSNRAAANLAGIGEATLRRWMDADPTFGARIAQARTNLEQKLARLIEAAAEQGDWRAAEAFLKRRYREDWTDSIQAEVSGPSGGPIVVQVDADATPDQVARAVAEALARANSSDNA